MKADIFQNEINLIKDKALRDFVHTAFEIVPDYFFSIPASSTGKYHPEYALGNEGLVRHIKACIAIVSDLFRMDMWKFTEHEKDLIIIALLLHDCWKMGYPEDNSEYTVAEHPLIASKELSKHFSNCFLITKEDLKYICDCIETHMGQWTKNHDDEEVLSRPKTTVQKFVHLVDYLASRKRLEINFDIGL